MPFLHALLLLDVALLQLLGLLLVPLLDLLSLLLPHAVTPSASAAHAGTNQVLVFMIICLLSRGLADCGSPLGFPFGLVAGCRLVESSRLAVEEVLTPLAAPLLARAHRARRVVVEDGHHVLGEQLHRAPGCRV